jgi:hypothetical protein
VCHHHHHHLLEASLGIPAEIPVNGLATPPPAAAATALSGATAVATSSVEMIANPEYIKFALMVALLSGIIQVCASKKMNKILVS